MIVNKFWAILIGLSIIFLLIGCSKNQTANSVNKISANRSFRNEEERQNFEEVVRNLEKNRALWSEKKISNYDFVIERFAEGMGGDWTRTFNVRDNKTLPLETKNGFPQLYQYENINSVEKLFDYIEQNFDSDFNVKATFNEELGYPEEIGLMARRSNGWVSIKIKQLKVINR